MFGILQEDKELKSISVLNNCCTSAYTCLCLNLYISLCLLLLYVILAADYFSLLQLRGLRIKFQFGSFLYFDLKKKKGKGRVTKYQIISFGKGEPLL